MTPTGLTNAPPGEQDLFGNGFLNEQMDTRTNGPTGALAWFGGLADQPDPSASTNSTPGPVIQDADEAQTVEIEAAVEGAREMARNGIGVLARGGASEKERERIEDNFNTLDPSYLAQAQSVLITTLGGLAGEVPIEVEGSVFPWQDDTVAGYVWGGPFAGSSAIHLTPHFFEVDANTQAGTILHEATHKYAGTADYAYVHDADYWTQDPSYAVWNADTYSNFCQLVEGDVREREAEEESARMKEVAHASAPALWDAYARGDIELYRTTFTLDDGTVLPAGAVGEAVVKYFGVRFPERRAEAVAAMAGGQFYGPFTCSDGFVVREDLYNTVYGEEGFE